MGYCFCLHVIAKVKLFLEGHVNHGKHVLGLQAKSCYRVLLGYYQSLFPQQVMHMPYTYMMTSD